MPAMRPSPMTRQRRAGVRGVQRTLFCCLGVFVALFVVALVFEGAAFERMLKRAKAEADLEEEDGTVQVDVRYTNAQYKAFEDDFARWVTHDNEALAPLIAAKKFRKVVEVPRYQESDLSFETFYKEFELKGEPVVIENVPIGGPKWTRERIGKICGDAPVAPLIPTDHAGTDWGNLQAQDKTSVTNFLKTLEDKSRKGSSSPYMHDWPIHKHCPRLLENYTVPKYFVQDYLGGLPVADKGYFTTSTSYPFRTSWPSLFIGENSTGSGLHIDSSHTHFVMHMISGVKEFKFIGRHDRVIAYENRDAGTFYSDLFNPNFTAHPTLALATVHTTKLRDGDLLFIPGGTAHQVVNHSPILSISTNFADASNIDRVLMEMDASFQYGVADSLRKHIDAGAVQTRMDPEPMLFSKLKEQQRRPL